MFAEKQKPISRCVNLVCLRGHRFPLCSFPFCVLLLVCIFTDWNYTLGCPNERTSDVSPSLLCYLSLGMCVASALLCACPLWATRFHNTTQCPNWSTCQDEKNRRRDKSGKGKRRGRRKVGKWKNKGVEDKTQRRRKAGDGMGWGKGKMVGSIGRGMKRDTIEALQTNCIEASSLWKWSSHTGVKPQWTNRAAVSLNKENIQRRVENHNTSFNVVLLESFIAIDEMCENLATGCQY